MRYSHDDKNANFNVSGGAFRLRYVARNVVTATVAKSTSWSTTLLAARHAIFVSNQAYGGETGGTRAFGMSELAIPALLRAF